MVAAWNQPGLTLAQRVKRLTGFPTRLEYLLVEAERIRSGCQEPRDTVHQPNKENTAVLSPSWCAACWEPFFAETRRPRLPEPPPPPHREPVPVWDDSGPTFYHYTDISTLEEQVQEPGGSPTAGSGIRQLVVP